MKLIQNWRNLKENVGQSRKVYLVGRGQPIILRDWTESEGRFWYRWKGHMRLIVSGHGIRRYSRRNLWTKRIFWEGLVCVTYFFGWRLQLGCHCSCDQLLKQAFWDLNVISAGAVVSSQLWSWRTDWRTTDIAVIYFRPKSSWFFYFL